MPDRRSTCLVFAAVLAWPGAALAQAQPEAGSTATAPAPASAPAPAPAPVSTTPAPASTTPAPATPPSPSSYAPPPPPPPPNTSTHKVSKGTPLIIAGVSITAGVYLFTALNGAVTIDEAKKDAPSDNPLTMENEAASTDQDRKRGVAQMVPIVGPFVAIRHTDSVTRQFGLAFNGTLQIAGVVMALVGIVQHSRYRKAQRWGLAAAPGLDGGSVAVHVRF